MARTDTPDFGNKELEEDLRRIRDGLPQLNGYADREAALIAAEKEKERQRQEEEEEEKERVRQERENEINSPGHSIAATAWSDWHMRVYFQNDEGGVHEAIHDDGVWKNGLSRNALFGARPQSPLAAISWHSGQQIRIYYLNHENIIHEYCYWAGKGWYAGNLNNLRVRAACYSRITAIHWPVDCSIRIYFQEPGSTTIQEYCYSSRNVGDVWTRGTSLYNACQGSALAATRWISGTLDSLHRNLHIRLYYQDSDLNLRELCWKFGGWSLGQSLLLRPTFCTLGPYLIAYVQVVLLGPRSKRHPSRRMGGIITKKVRSRYVYTCRTVSAQLSNRRFPVGHGGTKSKA